MIRLIAAVDSSRGIADDNGIPWQGKIPGDVRYYHQKIKNATTLIGYGMYKELSSPLVNKVNHVASRRGEKLRKGFVLVEDATKFLKAAQEDVWVLGGAALFDSTLKLADELYLTQLNEDFDCTKFFPNFKLAFKLQHESPVVKESGISYTFQTWVKR